MEYLLVCFFVYVWTMILFHESEKDESNNPTPDVKSVTKLPDAKLADQDQTTMKPGTKYRSVLNTPTVRLNRLNCNTLPSIPENQDGEDCAAEVEKLSAELKTTRYELQQQQQLAVSLQLLPDQIETELISVRKSLSEETAGNEQLRRQLSCLMAEKGELLEQLEQNKITTVDAIETVTTSYEKQMKKLRNELITATNQTVKPLTMEVGCGCVVEVANTSTQTGQSKTNDVGCSTEEPTAIPSHQVIGNSEQHVTKDEEFGFELDMKMMEGNKNRRHSFYIPARERTKKSPVKQVAPKPQVYFPVSDIRYKNKPISGYVVNPDGSIITYGDAVKSIHQKPSTEDPLHTQKTEDNVRKPSPDDSKNTPRTIISGPVKTEEELIVTSSPIEEKSLPGNRLLLTNIQGGDYGRIVGSGGSNIYRIETEYKIAVSIRDSVDPGTYTLMISGNNEEMRKAAADDIIRGLTVVTECSNHQLFNRIKNFRLNEVGRKFFVRINRTFASDGISGKMTLIGRLASCQSAYAELLAEIDVSQTKQKKRAY